ncbi:hypothetical protein O5O45_03380 [Hahella aquimaris]|uniref:VOC family protein n=1 Tax=Hahella sp. HNIBRBA332 TaxID=3015983 RepID=UPI00273BA2F4|nr:VOC family protein [Hahella sp. HNIBRBA332]WLQ14971.1 hypothetical protein O5O45_03380 [Hahella sp. HNIBRBA332]
MEVVGLDHINITAPMDLLESVRDFYLHVLALRQGPRPSGFRRQGFWLYADEAPILHLTASETADSDSTTTGYLDHVALSCRGLSETLQRLAEHGLNHSVEVVPGLGQTQIFLRDPAGLGVELNFVDEFPQDADRSV